MDAVSYSHSAKQAQRIEKFINNPDSTSGVLTQPSVIQTGETVNVPTGRTAILANTQIDGTLTVDGTVFIPSGATLDGVVEKVVSTDNAVVRFNGVTGEVQNSGVIIDDNNNLRLLSPVGNGCKLSIWAADAQTYGSWSLSTTNGRSLSITDDYDSVERIRIDANGRVLIGQSSSTSHAITGNNYATGLPVIQFGGDTTTNAVAIYAINQSSWSSSNAAATALRIGSPTTSRSINAAGTINASGADYAEYEYSNDITIAKGQIVGFKADGTLTDKYNESVRFAIKSTNPSIVGGDTWGIEDIVGKRPEQPVRKLDKTDQVQIEGTEELETIVIEAGDTNEEWEAIEAQYKINLADFEARLEVERQKVDRIAYAGKVPVNVYGAVAGQYVIAVEKDGGIDGKLVNKSDMTFTEYQDAVGRVNKILDDGRAEVAVIIH